ncbi:RNA polymerase sigma-54 factor RpoN [Fulvivirga imtechensis AK7]|uniref:RNA polymerase sigma-54 factor RpoN n=1 Tax=Fulvivirga imtechensis AK7 TaxID=1237149 RepID=L8JWU3_9BACT|nr:sigma-70 family RNA polymerase sigma factor [Fulvivirga imtechensis]ELR72099.1 RNA polymerase sigma-54 factor RpoN [Fulvivirga imtechensis AK7]
MEEKELVRSCLQGNKKSLEKLVTSIQGMVFNLAIRFLWNRMDAEDATQEILIKVITNLSKYDGRSKLNTWVYRVATNYLINRKQSILERELTSFDAFAQGLNTYSAPMAYDEPDKDILDKELKTGCTLAMLQCLNRDLRIAFILGSVLKIKSNVAANIVLTTPENFRKRLEKSRNLIGEFLAGHCGVYNSSNKCRCHKRINTAIKCGQINRNKLNFADKVEKYNEEMEEIDSLTGIYHNHGTFGTDVDLIAQLNELIQTKRIIND